MKVNIKGLEMELLKAKYANGRIALILCIPEETQQNYCLNVTVNIPEQHIKKDSHLIIKTWGDSKGVMEELIAQKVLSKPLDICYIGIEKTSICELLINANDLKVYE